MGGIEATRKITHRYPKIKVIAISSFSAAPFPQRFIENGALGYLTKDATIDEVAMAIFTVNRGKRYLSHSVAQQLAMNAVTGSDNASPFALLSERELQIALMVMDGVKTADIGGTLKVSPKTVNTYRYRLFEKLNIRSNMELAILASRHGLLMADDIRQ
jgi:DNA-binding NarL/FixJ family response regulator